MPDLNEGTTNEQGEAPEAGTAPAAPAQGTHAAPDEVTTLRSRNAGLDAKVTELSKAAKEAIARAEAAEARALALAEGKENGDAELRAQLEAQKALIAATQREAKLARIEAKYPESFGVLGEAAASLTEDQLAANEARLVGVAAAPEAPVPLGTGAARDQRSGPKALEDMTAKEIDAYMRSLPASVMFPNGRD